MGGFKKKEDASYVSHTVRCVLLLGSVENPVDNNIIQDSRVKRTTNVFQKSVPRVV